MKKFPTAEFHAGKRPWEVKCDVAIPAATQNELHLEDAKNLVENGCRCVVEAGKHAFYIRCYQLFLR